MARSRSLFTAVLVVLALALTEIVRVQSAAGPDSVTPGAARIGEPVTVQGRGFGALNVRVTVGDVPAAVVQADGARAVFRVPDGVPPGPTSVTVFNPGGQGGSLPFRVLEGILLPGASSARVVDATYDLAPGPFDTSQIRNGIFSNRLDLSLSPSATVGELNAALTAVQGGIVSMTRSSPFLTIAIPPADTLVALQEVAKLLDTLPGITLAAVTQEARPLQVFNGTTLEAITNISHLLPSRFPAAWNLANTIVDPTGNLCVTPSIPVLIADDFGASAPDGFATLVPGFPAPAPATRPLTPEEAVHGYDVTLVLGANGLGANPVRSCLALKPVQSAALSSQQALGSLVSAMPATGKFLVNYSLGFGGEACAGSPCQPPRDVLLAPVSRASAAAFWELKTRDRWEDFLIVAAAGNERFEESARIYPGMGDSRFTSAINIASATSLSDGFEFVADASLWAPPPAFAAAGFEPLTSDALETAAVRQLATDFNLIGVREDNVIVVGSATSQSPGSVLTAHVTPEQLGESFFSDSGAEVLAVGENIFGQPQVLGTSYATPQVTGLASYLWALSSELRDSRPVTVTRRAILANTRNRVIDAYASVLSLDPPAPLTPQSTVIRRNLLDVDDDGAFTDLDVLAFLRRLYVVDPNTGEISRAAAGAVTADFSRFDLNGDGFTTAASRRERFDLDRAGSTQYGAAIYQTISENIEGQEIRFDETALTDVEILCYYAYSPLYQGNPDTRKDLLAGRCGLSVRPATVTLNSGQTQQFTAQVPDNSGVTWTAQGGTINTSGVFTAGSTAGTFKVRATSTNDPNLFGEATVTVVGGAGGLTVTYARAASLLARGQASDFYCPPGPTVEPSNPNDDYWTRTPNGLARGSLSSPPPNVGRFVQVGRGLEAIGGSATVQANCRYVARQPNSSEIRHTVTASGSSVTWQVYLSSTTDFGLPAGGEAFALIGIPADGFIDVTVDRSWIKAISPRGGDAFFQARGALGHVTCLFELLPPNQINTSCTSTTRIPVVRGENLILHAVVSANAEGNGMPLTLTYTRASP